MKNTKTAIKELTAMYRNVLLKGLYIAVGALLIAPGGVRAEDAKTWTEAEIIALIKANANTQSEDDIKSLITANTQSESDIKALISTNAQTGTFSRSDATTTDTIQNALSVLTSNNSDLAPDTTNGRAFGSIAYTAKNIVNSNAQSATFSGLVTKNGTIAGEIEENRYFLTKTSNLVSGASYIWTRDNTDGTISAAYVNGSLIDESTKKNYGDNLVKIANTLTANANTANSIAYQVTNAANTTTYNTAATADTYGDGTIGRAIYTATQTANAAKEAVNSVAEQADAASAAAKTATEAASALSGAVSQIDDLEAKVGTGNISIKDGKTEMAVSNLVDAVNMNNYMVNSAMEKAQNAESQLSDETLIRANTDKAILEKINGATAVVGSDGSVTLTGGDTLDTTIKDADGNAAANNLTQAVNAHETRLVNVEQSVEKNANAIASLFGTTEDGEINTTSLSKRIEAEAANGLLSDGKTTIESAITTNAGKIGRVAEAVDGVSSSLIKLEKEKVDVNTAAIGKLNGAVDVEGSVSYKIANEAANATFGDTTIGDALTEHETAIAQNKTAIKTNADNIAANTGRIEVNEKAIATNTADIAANKADIAANKASIDTLNGDVETAGSVKHTVFNEAEDAEYTGTTVATNARAAGGQTIKSALSATATQVNTNTADIASVRQDLSDTKKRYDARFAGMDNRINDLEDDMKKGLASNAALASLVPMSSEHKTQISMGMGGYQDKQGLALGAFHYASDNVLLNAGASWGGDDSYSYKAGVTFGF